MKKTLFMSVSRTKFGFPFVICARENKVEAILTGLGANIKYIFLGYPVFTLHWVIQWPVPPACKRGNWYVVNPTTSINPSSNFWQPFAEFHGLVPEPKHWMLRNKTEWILCCLSLGVMSTPSHSTLTNSLKEGLKKIWNFPDLMSGVGGFEKVYFPDLKATYASNHA